MPYDDLHMIGC